MMNRNLKISTKLIRPAKSIDFTNQPLSTSANFEKIRFVSFLNSYSLMKNFELSSTQSFIGISNPFESPWKNNSKKPPLPKKPLERSRALKSQSSNTTKPASKCSRSGLALTPRKLKLKLSLSPHRKGLRRKDSTRKKLLLQL